MALGTVSNDGPCRAIEVLASATATNSVPSGATAGLDMNLVARADNERPESVSLVIASTAGSATMTATFKLWGYCPGAADWVPLGPHKTATSKGLINFGNAVTEHAADALRHAETVNQIFDFSRVYLEITAIGGTSTAVTAWLQWRR
jgi:hypothetical protein